MMMKLRLLRFSLLLCVAAISRTCDGASFFKKPHVLQLIQVHVVHRHGDRTPITPLQDESYWSSELVQEALSDKMSQVTTIQRNNDASMMINTHAAAGKGPFGKLTQLGLLQMVQLGSELRAQLVSEDDDADGGTEDEHGHLHHDKLFSNKNPLEPSKLKVYSTDFERTIQSVQGTLVGLFPDDDDDSTSPIEVDARHTHVMIPDPQPRQSKEQVKLEQSLVKRAHVVARDAELQDMAKHATQALAPLLHADAFGVTYGVGEEDNDSSSSKFVLSWAQLAEISKCLSVRDSLPASITKEMMDAISSHTAWRWMETLSHPRMAYLSMNRMLSDFMLSSMLQRRIKHQADAPPPLLSLYSAHDSTLIGLLCALRLEQPAKWPEYASYFKMELIQATPRDDDDDDTDIKYFVRCSLNNERLQCQWEDEHEEPLDMIPLEQLVHLVATKGSTTACEMSP